MKRFKLEITAIAIVLAGGCVLARRGLDAESAVTASASSSGTGGAPTSGNGGASSTGASMGGAGGIASTTTANATTATSATASASAAMSSAAVTTAASSSAMSSSAMSSSAMSSSSTGGPTCAPNGTATISDDFSSQKACWSKYMDPGGSVSINNGHLQISIDGSNKNYSGEMTPMSYSLLDCSLEIELLNGTAHARNVVSFTFQSAMNGGDRVDFEQSNGSMSAFLFAANVNQSSKTFPAPSNQPIYLRFRESMGTVSFDISSDDVTWTQVHSVPTPAWADDGQINLVLGPSGSGTPSAEQVEFDGLNL